MTASQKNPPDSILLIEDELKVLQLMEAYLSKNGFGVVAVDSGEKALKAFCYQVFDLVVLDLNLPGMDGLDVLRAIRRRGALPVLVVSARKGGEDRVGALEEGADDYLTKPYYPVELVARIRALLRRARLPSTQRPSRMLEIHPQEREVLLHGSPVELTQREYDLLVVLASEPGRTFSREELFAKVWGRTDLEAVRRVDHYVSRLRSRIQEPNGEDLILSIYGKGYRLKPIL